MKKDGKKRKAKRLHILRSFRQSGIKTQLYTVYFLALILPIAVIGIFLVWNTNRLLTNYHWDLLEADNSRVRSILFEITTQVYNISEDLTFDEGIQDVLRTVHGTQKAMAEKADRIPALDSYSYNYAEIEELLIYTDNITVHDYKQFRYADEEIRNKKWYQRAVSQSSVFWVPVMNSDKYGNEYWNLCLVRKIPVLSSDYHAVLVIKVSDNYLHTRIGSREYGSMVSVDREPVFFSSDRSAYGLGQAVPIDYGEKYYKYAGKMKIDDSMCFVDVSALPMYQSDSIVYITTMNMQVSESVRNITAICILIILANILLPGIFIRYFTSYFASRVLTLRQAMHQASNEDYEFTAAVRGKDELSEVFSDLEIMVQRIKEKDAGMYEARIKEKELLNRQQEMEFKMLASQINPHFLYNTLETIRMRAFTAGDREAAKAIKMLGKSLRYVLDNTGKVVTTLDKELGHVENYLAIQKLRFGEKFGNFFEIEEGVEPEKIFILPLILQPIVENAVLHGLEEKESGGEIRVHVYIRQEFFFIDVEDNGCGMEEEELKKLRCSIEVRDTGRSKSIGLYNISQRLSLHYGGARNLRIYSESGKGTMVRLTFFLENMKNVR